MQLGPHIPVALGGPDAGRIDAECFVVRPCDPEAEAVFVDGIAGKRGITCCAASVPRVLQRAAARGDPGNGPVGGMQRVAGELDGLADACRPDQRIPAPRRDGLRNLCGDGRERPGPVTEVGIAALAPGVVLNDVGAKEDAGVGDPGHDFAGSMGSRQMRELHSAPTHMDGHPVLDRQRGPVSPGMVSAP